MHKLLSIRHDRVASAGMSLESMISGTDHEHRAPTWAWDKADVPQDGWPQKMPAGSCRLGIMANNDEILLGVYGCTRPRVCNITQAASTKPTWCSSSPKWLGIAKPQPPPLCSSLLTLNRSVALYRIALHCPGQHHGQHHQSY